MLEPIDLTKGATALSSESAQSCPMTITPCLPYLSWIWLRRGMAARQGAPQVDQNSTIYTLSRLSAVTGSP